MTRRVQMFSPVQVLRRSRQRWLGPPRTAVRRIRAEQIEEHKLEARYRRWQQAPLVAAVTRVYHRPLGAHVAALLVLVALVAPHLNLLAHSWVTDEGLYAIQAQELSQGHWHYDYPGADFDPEGRWYGLPQATRSGDLLYPYVKHPAFPLALFGTVSVFGKGLGFYVLPIAGLVLSAVAAWLLAARLEPRAARIAFWLVAASPLLMNAFVVWAHTMSAALAGFGALLIVSILQRRGAPVGAVSLHALGLGALLAAGILLRTEGLLVAVALTSVAGLALLVQRRLLAAAACVVAGVTATVLTLRWEAALIASITQGGAPSSIASPGDAPGLGAVASLPTFIADRWDAFWRVVLDGSTTRGAGAGRGGVFVVAALAVLGLSALALRLGEGRRAQRIGAWIAVTGVTVALILYQLRFALAPYDELSGYLAAWPIVVVGLVLWSWRRTGSVERWLLFLVALYAGAVFATQYGAGGTVEWGGRFLSPTVVPLAVLVAVAVMRQISDRLWTQRWLVAAALILLVVASAARGLVMIGGSRGEVASLYRHLGEPGHEVIVVVDPDAWRRPINAWSIHEQSDWYYATSEPEIRELMAHLEREGVRDVTLLGIEQVQHVAPSELAGDAPAPTSTGPR